MLKRLCLPVLGALVLAGCLHSPVAMTPSSKPLVQGGYDVLRPASASDCLWTLFGLIPISSGNTLQGALQKAIAAGGGDALIQVTADSFYQHFIIVARSCTQVEGVGARSRAPAPLAPAAPPPM